MLIWLAIKGCADRRPRTLELSTVSVFLITEVLLICVALIMPYSFACYPTSDFFIIYLRGKIMGRYFKNILPNGKKWFAKTIESLFYIIMLIFKILDD